MGFRSDKNKFLIYKEILSGVVAMSFMRKSFLINEEMRKYLVIYEEAVSHIWLCNHSLLDFLIYEEFFLSFLSERQQLFVWSLLVFFSFGEAHTNALFSSNVTSKNVRYILILIVILIAHPLHGSWSLLFSNKCPQYGSPQLTRRCFLLQLTPQVREQGRLW